jgi:hypothetical protein
MTHHIITIGLRPVVVGRDGEIYDVEQGSDPRCFGKINKRTCSSPIIARAYDERTPEFKALLEI